MLGPFSHWFQSLFAMFEFFSIWAQIGANRREFCSFWFLSFWSVTPSDSSLLDLYFTTRLQVDKRNFVLDREGKKFAKMFKSGIKRTSLEWNVPIQCWINDLNFVRNLSKSDQIWVKKGPKKLTEICQNSLYKNQIQWAKIRSLNLEAALLSRFSDSKPKMAYKVNWNLSEVLIDVTKSELKMARKSSENSSKLAWKSLSIFYSDRIVLWFGIWCHLYKFWCWH